MSAIVVFVGPTIALDDARRTLDATYRPPATAGDLYVCARQRPLAIGLIDGLFGTVASVFHKEILWAMRAGVHVFGAASMGALRAAELNQYGMVGVGAVYEAYRSETLVDDDEVAVAHLDAAHAHRATSDAMVNIRATLDAASAQGIFGVATRDQLERLAKSMHYPDRTVRKAVEHGRRHGLPVAELDDLDEWLGKNGIVDVKRADAVELLVALQELDARRPGPKHVTYPFAATAFWESLRVESDRDASSVDATEPQGEWDRHVLTELRLDEAFGSIHHAALSEVLARREADRCGYALDEDGIRQTADDLWDDLGLENNEDIDDWMAERHLDAVALTPLLLGEATRQWARSTYLTEVRPAVLAQLRLSAHYPRLRRRAQSKRQRLAALGLDGVHDPIGLDDDDMWTWWSARHHRARRTNLLVDARGHGFTDVSSFRQAVIDEYHFVTRSGLTEDHIHLADDDADRGSGPPEGELPITVSVAALRALLRRSRSGGELTDADIVTKPNAADV